MIGVFLDYRVTPQVPAAEPLPAEPSLADHERRILDFLRQRPRPTVWAAVNAVVRQLPAQSRTQTRCLRLKLLGVINSLLHRRVIRRVGRSYIALCT